MSNKFQATFNIFVFLALTCIASFTFASTCNSLFDSERFDQAIPLCLQEKNYFKLGKIYEKKSDCFNSTKYYEKSAAPSAIGNLGILFYYGQGGCEIDKERGVSLLEEAALGREGFGKILGDHYKNEGNTFLAKKYYKAALEYSGSTDWDLRNAKNSFSSLQEILDDDEKKSFYMQTIKLPERPSKWQKEMAEQAFSELRKILDYDEKKSLYLEALRLPDRPSAWQEEMADLAIGDLKNILPVTEQLDLFFKFLRDGAKYKCDMGSYLYSQRFNNLLVELQKQNRKEMFFKGLGNCEGKKEYFLALTYENGLGNKEDFREAYRLYLIAGSKGNIEAKMARDRIRDNLSADQIEEATCLADYGIEPSMIRKWFCGW